MWILIVGLIALTLIAMIIGKWYYYRINKKIEKGELQEAPAVVEVDDECCGQHEVCEKDSLLAAVSKGIEYYDDEELDRFRGRASDDYTDEEVEEFREVMLKRSVTNKYYPDSCPVAFMKFEGDFYSAYWATLETNTN